MNDDDLNTHRVMRNYSDGTRHEVYRGPERGCQIWLALYFPEARQGAFDVVEVQR